VIPITSARITYVAFFNADTEEVTVVETTQDVQAFLADDQPVEGVDTDNRANQETSAESSSCDIRIVLQYTNGTTETTCVSDGTTVTVETNRNSTHDA
jgi:hypothetical protein